MSACHVNFPLSFFLFFFLLLFAAGSSNRRQRAGLSGGRWRRRVSARRPGGGAWRRRGDAADERVADDGVGARHEAELGDDGLGGGGLGGGGCGGREAEHGAEEERLANCEVGWSTSSYATNPVCCCKVRHGARPLHRRHHRGRPLHLDAMSMN
uniref:Uncharacterized protein n=1 Tax=Oryza glumipatula TaxID=40148 RepID=A0A0D9ZY38_9ORYZ